MFAKQQIVLGLGAGHCGLNLLAEIFAQQPSSRITLEQRPLLPWKPVAGRPGIRERLERWEGKHHDHIVGDIATFYLPYVEQAVELRPELKAVCLWRPCDEIVAGFCRQMDQHYSLPTNHWTTESGVQWSHDPLWSATFPQYDTTDRIEGLRRYWHEYYQQAEDLARRFPLNFRLNDTELLTTTDGVRSILDFVGIPRDQHVIITGRKPAPPNIDAILRSRPVKKHIHPLDPAKCVVLVPYSGSIFPECDDALKALERRGYQVRRVGGYAAIDQGRNQMRDWIGRGSIRSR